MTKDELCAQCNIPCGVLNEYERYIKNGAAEYRDEDIEKLSLMMTLLDSGFSSDEALRYISLCERDDVGCSGECMKMLNERRRDTLEDIHRREKQLDCIDRLRYKITK